MDNNEFVSELSKLRSSSTFLTIKSYTNESSEVADYSIIFHMSYKNALERSISVIDSFIPNDDFEAQAKLELLVSFNTSLDKLIHTPIEELNDGYTRFFDSDGSHIKGVKLHKESQTLHLYGLVVHKKVLIPGNYKKINKKPLTIVKDKLRYMTPVGKFRQFKITPDQVESISVENISLLPPE